jgi:hypothetical protein
VNNACINVQKTQARGPRDFLGMHIQRNCQRGTISIHQENKALATGLGVNGQHKATSITPETFAGLWITKTGEPMPGKAVSGHHWQFAASCTMHKALHCPVCWCTGSLLCSAECCAMGHSTGCGVLCGLHSREITFWGWAAPLELWCDANCAMTLGATPRVGQ